MRLWVGTSGYSYKEWRGKFYPPRLPAKEMLRFYASRFAAVEINNSFYRLPKETVLQSWSGQVPADFRFVLKAPRRITHTKRLKDAGAGVEDLFSIAAALGLRQGAILFQLPPNFKKDVERLRTFLSLLPADRPLEPGRYRAALTFQLGATSGPATTTYSPEFVIDVTVRYWQKAKSAGLPRAFLLPGSHICQGGAYRLIATAPVLEI